MIPESHIGLISVIVPCYKVDTYLPNITNDLLIQDHPNFEVIFVNDGDDELDYILSEIKKQDSRFSVIKKRNGGLGSARNAGLDAARGEWIVFVDPDDRIGEHFLSSLYDAVTANDSDFAMGGFRSVNVKTNTTEYHFVDKEIADESPLSLADFFNYIEYKTYFRSAWNKIFKASIISEHSIRHDEKYKSSEDWKFNLEYYRYIKKVALVEDCGYRYMAGNPNSLIARYVDDTVTARMKNVDLITDLRRVVGRSEESIARERKHDLAYLYLDLIKNLFCTRMHPRLSEAKKIIANELLANEEMMDAFMNEKFIKFSDKVQQKIVSTRNAAIIVYIHYMLYKLNDLRKIFMN